MLSFLAISCLILLLPQLSAQRIEAAPAVWGDPAPDYSAVVLDNTVRYVYALLFIDDKIASYYEYDMLRVKEEVLKVVTEANNYFIQLKISVAVVDVLQTRRSNLSLLMFQEYRSVRKNELPYHDFAALMTMKYPGGLAYVSGMCTDLSVMLCGYYPSDPQVMGSIFFHEAAHLFGVPHRPANVSLHVPNCACTGNEGPSTGGCLKIPGFDHDCTAQQLANTLYKSKCLNTKPVQMKTLALCGNGVLEPGEYCDCGKNLTCNVFNCVPATCSYKIRPLWMVGSSQTPPKIMTSHSTRQSSIQPRNQQLKMVTNQREVPKNDYDSWYRHATKAYKAYLTTTNPPVLVYRNRSPTKIVFPSSPPEIVRKELKSNRIPARDRRNHFPRKDTRKLEKHSSRQSKKSSKIHTLPPPPPFRKRYLRRSSPHPPVPTLPLPIYSLYRDQNTVFRSRQ